MSGGKGVHLVVPIAKRYAWEVARDFCDAFAHDMEARAPQRYVATMSKAKREGRIFIELVAQWTRRHRGRELVLARTARRAGGDAGHLGRVRGNTRAGSLQAPGCAEADRRAHRDDASAREQRLPKR